MRRAREGFKEEGPNFPHKLAQTSKNKQSIRSKTPRQATFGASNVKIVRPKTEMLGNRSNLVSTRHLLQLETISTNRSRADPSTPSVSAAINIKDVKADEWLADFERNKQSNKAAHTIQCIWSAYRIKKRCEKFFFRRIATRSNSLILIFNAWRAYASHDISVISSSYNKVIDLTDKFPTLVKNSMPNPFPIFYLTGRIFFPNAFTKMKISPNMFNHMSRTFLHPSGKHILQLWNRIKISRKGYREKCHTFLYTLKKVEAFGKVFITFVLWHRYTVLKKQFEQNKDGFAVKYSEELIEWRAWVKFLSLRKAKEHRADENHLKNVRKRAYMAIHQNLVEKRQYMADLSSSHNFYLRRIQETAKKSWLKFIEYKKQQRAVLLKLQRSWYTISYWRAEKEFTTTTYIYYKEASIKNAAFFGWRKEAKLQKLLAIKASIKFIEKPSIPRQFIFLLMKLDSLVIFERAFKEWIEYTKKRHALKEFIKIFQKRDEDRELKQIAFYSLKRAAELNLIKRLVHAGNKFFPNKLMISLEGTKKDYQEAKGKSFRFYTESTPDADKSDIFNRLLLLVLDNEKHYEAARIESRKSHKEKRFTFGLISYQDIRKMYEQNCLKVRKAMGERLMRDKAIISAIDSHFAAVELSNVVKNFTCSEDFKLDTIRINPIRRMEVDVDALESINVHIHETSSEKYVPIEWIRNYINDEKRKFNNRIRKPTIVYMKQDMIAESAKLERNANHQNSVDNKTSTAVLMPFELAKPQVKIPFKNPSIGALKKMLKRDGKEYNMSAHSNITLSIDQIKPKIEKLDPLTSIKIFFLTIAGIKLDIKSVDPPEMTASMRRIYRRNVAAFVASFMGYDITTSVPTGIDCTPLNRYIKAINGTFNCLKQFPSILSFCGEIPFSEKFAVDSDSAIDIRSFIYAAVLHKFTKLEYRERSFISDELSINDLLITSIMLPYILRPDFVREFIKEELKSAQQDK